MADQTTNGDVFKIIKSSFDQISERRPKTRIPPLESWRKKRVPKTIVYLEDFPFNCDGAVGGGGPQARPGQGEKSDQSKPPTGKDDAENIESPLDQPDGVNVPAQGAQGDDPDSAENPASPAPGRPSVQPEDPDSEEAEDESEDSDSGEKEEDEANLETAEDEGDLLGQDAPDIFKKKENYIIQDGGVSGVMAKKVNVQLQNGSRWQIVNQGVEGDWTSDDIKQKFLITFYDQDGVPDKQSQTLSVSLDELSQYKNNFAVVWNTLKLKNNQENEGGIKDAEIEIIATDPVDTEAPGN